MRVRGGGGGGQPGEERRGEAAAPSPRESAPPFSSPASPTPDRIPPKPGRFRGRRQLVAAPGPGQRAATATQGAERVRLGLRGGRGEAGTGSPEGGGRRASRGPLSR